MMLHFEDEAVGFSGVTRARAKTASLAIATMTQHRRARQSDRDPALDVTLATFARAPGPSETMRGPRGGYLAVDLPRWLRWRHLVAAGAGLAVGLAFWIVPNHQSDVAMFQVARRVDTVEAYREYVRVGSHYRAQARDYWLPLAALRVSMKRGAALILPSLGSSWTSFWRGTRSPRTCWGRTG